MTAASDNLREASGNAVTAYTFSSLEQYIPLFLMQTVRVIASGGGIVSKSPLTLNGVEALDRSGSVLYRDLKGATGFDNSFWDDELAAISFERSASFMAMMELEIEEVRQDETIVQYMMLDSLTVFLTLPCHSSVNDSSRPTIEPIMMTFRKATFNLCSP